MYVTRMLLYPVAGGHINQNLPLNESLISFHLELVFQKAVDKFYSVNILKMDFLCVFQQLKLILFSLEKKCVVKKKL